MAQLSDNYMLDVLSKVQPFQAEIIKTGRSAHLDVHYHEFGSFEHSIDFDFYVFENTDLVKTFEFNSSETSEEVEAVLISLVAYVNSL